jgi:hypothetical protein
MCSSGGVNAEARGITQQLQQLQQQMQQLQQV